MGILTESSTFDSDITVPVAGDNVSAPVIVAGAIQKLTNRTRFLLNGINGFIVGNGAGADYTPTGAPIQIFGTGLRVIGALFRATGDVEIGNDDSDTLTVTSTSEFDGPVTLTAGLTIGSSTDNGPSSDVYGNITFRRTTAFGTSSASVTVNSWATWTHTGSFNIAGGSAFAVDITPPITTHNNIEFGGSSKTVTCKIPFHCNANAPATFDTDVTLGIDPSSDLIINASGTLYAPLVCAGAGRVVEQTALVTTGDYTFSSTGPRAVVYTAPVGANNAVIDDSGMQNGDRIRLVVESGAGGAGATVTLSGLASGTVDVSAGLVGGHGGGFVEAERVGGGWHIMAFGGHVTPTGFGSIVPSVGTMNV